ncbi:MAG: cell division protein ZapA [Firmicutes bacterium HGW-Firmicutes-13]|nr:MAG: cell division protein ZapA [Firmicutes bacterium HGW-Firmicutes-13]
MSEKNKVKVNIFGDEYTLKAELPVNYMKKLAGYVDTKMHEFAQKGISQGTHKIAVLTAINLTDEIFNLRRELKHVKAKLEKEREKFGDRVPVQSVTDKTVKLEKEIEKEKEKEKSGDGSR